MRASVIFMILAISCNATALHSVPKKIKNNNQKLWVKKTLPSQLDAAKKNISTAPGKIRTKNYFNRTDRHKHKKSLAHRTHSKTELDKYISSAKRTREIFPTQNYDREEEENNNEWNAFATAAMISLTFLALVTIIFEKGKEILVERASKSLRPVITSLFSELTVLGFLGLVTFLITKTKILPELSVELFCNGDCYRVCRMEENPIICVKEKMNQLQELFESIHMSLFMVMVLFIVLGLINLKISTHTYKKWQQWENLCIDNFDNVRKNYRRNSSGRGTVTLSQMVFSSIRDVFVKNEKKPKQSLNRDFAFSLYLFEILGKEVAEITEVPVSTWLFLEIVLFCWYCFTEIVQGDTILLQVFWISIAWSLVFLAFILRHKLESICLNCCVAEDLGLNTKKLKNNNDIDENTLLIDGDRIDFDEDAEAGNTKTLSLRLPQYEDITPKSSSSPLNCILLRGKGPLPSRHEMLFWARRNGPAWHVFLIRQLMLLMSIYVALFTMLYTTHMAVELESDDATWMDVVGNIILFLLAYLPVFFVLTTLPLIIRLHVQSCSIGSFRHHHRETMKHIIRVQRTETALRVMRVLSNARTLAFNRKKEAAKEIKKMSKEGNLNVYNNAGVNKLSPEQEVALRRQLEDAERAWRCIDVDNSGTIDENEMKLLMQSIGLTCGKDEIAQMMLELDLDGDGDITKDEFIKWIVKQNDTEPGVDELAQILFDMFDTDHSGSISVQEFIEKMQRVAKDLSLEDITMIARELDEDQSGSIEMVEFKEFLEKHSEDFAHH
jgi:Ca2+-binding EF-hand superfamily protein